MGLNTIIQGDIRQAAPTLPAQSVNCIVTSPPYWKLRDYGHPDQIGLEPTPEVYVQTLVSIFQELRRVLRDDGTLWLNLGDCYYSNPGNGRGGGSTLLGGSPHLAGSQLGTADHPKLKPKSLIGIPWRVALALQADGWILRQDIIWNKTNALPESVTDRPTRSHEYVFLFSKSAKYYYDQDAIREPYIAGAPEKTGNSTTFKRNGSKRAKAIPGQAVGTHRQDRTDNVYGHGGRNKRSVWNISTKAYLEAHFAVFPPELAETCILAGCPPAGVVLDPFLGSGTVAQVCIETGRNWLGVELNQDYINLAKERIAKARPVLVAPVGYHKKPVQVAEQPALFDYSRNGGQRD